MASQCCTSRIVERPQHHATPHQWATTGCRHWVAWMPAIFIDSVVTRSTVVAQDHRRPYLPRCRCESLEHATTDDHVIAVTADFQVCIEDGTVFLQIVRQRQGRRQELTERGVLTFLPSPSLPSSPSSFPLPSPFLTSLPLPFPLFPISPLPLSLPSFPSFPLHSP